MLSTLIQIVLVSKSQRKAVIKDYCKYLFNCLACVCEFLFKMYACLIYVLSFKLLLNINYHLMIKCSIPIFGNVLKIEMFVLLFKRNYLIKFMIFKRNSLIINSSLMSKRICGVRP